MAGLAIKQKTPPQLRKVSDGRIFSYTPELAQRADMVAYWPDGAPDGFMPEAHGLGLQKGGDSGDVEFVKKELRQKDKQLLQMQQSLDQISEENRSILMQLDEVSEERNSLLNAVERLKIETGIDLHSYRDPVEVPSANTDDKPEISQERPENWQSLVVESVKGMMERNDPNDFTGSGKPRVEKIEEYCGFQINAAERDVAFKTVSDSE